MKEITLEITNKCHNSCLHCSGRADEKGHVFLDFDTIKNKIDKYNPQWVNISGGEPLLHKDIQKIIEYIYSSNIKIKLYTSGYCSNFLEKVRILHKYIDTIVFPYYSCKSSEFNYITNNYKGRFYSEKGIQIAGMYNMNIEIHIVPMSINLNSLEETIEYLFEKYKSIKKINILKLVNQGRVNDNPNIIPDDTLLKETISKIKDKFSDKIKLGLPLNKEKCIAGIEKMVIMCNRKEIPCESYKDGICKCNRLYIK